MTTNVAAEQLDDTDVELLVALVRGDLTGDGLTSNRIAHVRAELGHPWNLPLRQVGDRLVRMKRLGLLDRYKRRSDGDKKRYRLTKLGAETLAKLI